MLDDIILGVAEIFFEACLSGGDIYPEQKKKKSGEDVVPQPGEEPSKPPST